MVPRPEPAELVGLIGLVVGFVVFTFGGLEYAAGRTGFGTVGQIFAGGLLGFAAAGWLVVHYHVLEIVGR